MRSTDDDRESRRRTASIVDGLGQEVRRSRRRLRLTQGQLAARVGVHQTWISDIELGRGDGVPLATWVSLGVALDRPLAISFSKAIDPASTLADAGHLEMQEVVLGLAAATGRAAVVERPSRPEDPSHSTDIAIRDDPHRTLILVEAWNTFGDLGAAIRSTTRKVAEVAAAEAGRPRPYRVVTVWLVRASATNRALISTYPSLFAATFDGSSRAWVKALTDGATPPERPGLVWFEPGAGRLMAWRRR